MSELDLKYFKQVIGDNVFCQPSPHSKVQLVQIPKQETSFRIAGGTSCLIKTLFNKLDPADILFDQSVKEIKVINHSVQVHTHKTFEADTVVLAIPPKLWSKKIIFDPKPPADLQSVATQTQTWMEDSIKVALTYEKPFWKESDSSSTLFINSGAIIFCSKNPWHYILVTAIFI